MDCGKETQLSLWRDRWTIFETKNSQLVRQTHPAKMPGTGLTIGQFNRERLAILVVALADRTRKHATDRIILCRLFFRCLFDTMAELG